MKRQITAISAAAMFALVGCSSGGDDTAASSSPAAELTGTWTGEASYAVPDGSTGGGPETLVIEKQEGPKVWGYTQYTDTDGTLAKNVITGTVTDNGQGFVLTEPQTIWQGRVSGDEMTVVVTWNDSEADHGSFEMTMTKQ